MKKTELTINKIYPKTRRGDNKKGLVYTNRFTTMAMKAHAIEFAEWLATQEINLIEGDYYWQEDNDGDHPLDIKKIYNNFDKEK